MINEPKETNSGTPQGVFLKRQMVLKQDGSNTPLLPTDFRIGLDVGIFGRSIRIYDCDQYTREFFDVRYKTLAIFIYLNYRVSNKHSQMLRLLLVTALQRVK